MSIVAFARQITDTTDRHFLTLESAAEFMLKQAERALRAHDLEEAVFWQSPYLTVRAILRAEDDLDAFHVGGVRHDYPAEHDAADSGGTEHADDCRRCAALAQHQRM